MVHVRNPGPPAGLPDGPGPSRCPRVLDARALRSSPGISGRTNHRIVDAFAALPAVLEKADPTPQAALRFPKHVRHRCATPRRIRAREAHVLPRARPEGQPVVSPDGVQRGSGRQEEVDRPLMAAHRHAAAADLPATRGPSPFEPPLIIFRGRVLRLGQPRRQDPHELPSSPPRPASARSPGGA